MRSSITQTLADGLQPSARDRFVWDDVLPGFGLKLTPAGRRIYVFQFRLGGRGVPTRRITIGGEHDGWTASSARDRARELAAEISVDRPPPRAAATAAPPAHDLTTPKTPGEPWQIRLGFLAADVARLQSTLLRRGMKRLSASHAQWGMLAQLSLHEGVTQMELAKFLDLSKVAVTGLVNRVVRAGWVERRLDERDRRVRRLYLTREAKRAVAAMRAEVDTVISASMGHIPDAEGEAIVATFDGIKSRLVALARDVRHRKAPLD